MNRQSAIAWALNRRDGLSLIIDRLRRYTPCGVEHPRIGLVCDRPSGHVGSHAARSFAAGVR